MSNTVEKITVGELICQLVAMGSMNAQVFLIGDGYLVQVKDDLGEQVYLHADDGQNDSARLDWLMSEIPGKTLRNIGVVFSGYADQRIAIDRAMTAAGEVDV